MSENSRKRGRPATIDSDAAMRSVVEIFRAKGFAATSLDDLVEATGLSRPSLYRAFGDKLAMYISAMDAFGAQVAETAVPKLNDAERLEQALSDFFEAMASIYYRDGQITPGCLVFGTAPSNADRPEIQRRLRSGIEGLDGLMRARIVKSAPNCDDGLVATAVALASNTLIAFSARAKSGASKRELVDMGARSARAIALLIEADGNSKS